MRGAQSAGPCEGIGEKGKALLLVSPRLFLSPMFTSRNLCPCSFFFFVKQFLSAGTGPLFRPVALPFIDVRDQSRRQHCKEVQRSSAEAELAPAAPSSRTQQQQDEKPVLPILQGEDVPVSIEAAAAGMWEGMGRKIERCSMTQPWGSQSGCPNA